MAEEEPQTTAQEAEPEKLVPKVETESLGPCQVKLKVEVAAEKVAELVEKKYGELNSTVQVPGFRLGKAPRALLERKLGKAVVDDVRADILERSYGEAVEAAGIEVVGNPGLKPESFPFEPGKAFLYEVTLDVMPKVELKPYDGIEVTRKKIDATDAEIDDGIRQLRENRAEWAPLESGKSQSGDQIIADFTLTLGDQVVEETENQALFLQPTIHLLGLPLEKLHEELAGRAPGDAVDFPIAFPPDHAHKTLAGKETRLAVKIKSVKRKNVPDVDEKFLKSFDMDTADELRQEVRRQVLRQKEAQQDEALKDEIVEKILRVNEFPIPEPLAKTAGEEMLARTRTQLLMRGVPEDQIAPALQEHEERLRKAGVDSVKAMWVLDAVAKKERIFATEEQVDERVAHMAQHYGKWPHEMRKELEDAGILASLRREIRTDLVREDLLRRAKVVEEEPPASPAAGAPVQAEGTPG